MSKNSRSRRLIQILALLIAALGCLVIIYVLVDGFSPNKVEKLEETKSDNTVLFTPVISIESSAKQPTQPSQSMIEKPPPMPLSAETSDDISTIVYITKGGKKYHRKGCQYLSNSSIPIDLNKAKEKGYTPCSKCHPRS